MFFLMSFIKRVSQTGTDGGTEHLPRGSWAQPARPGNPWTSWRKVTQTCLHVKAGVVHPSIAAAEIRALQARVKNKRTGTTCDPVRLTGKFLLLCSHLMTGSSRRSYRVRTAAAFKASKTPRRLSQPVSSCPPVAVRQAALPQP